MGLSAVGDNDAAFALANGEVSGYANEILSEIEQMMQQASGCAEVSRQEMAQVYRKRFFLNLRIL